MKSVVDETYMCSPFFIFRNNKLTVVSEKPKAYISFSSSVLVLIV